MGPEARLWRSPLPDLGRSSALTGAARAVQFALRRPVGSRLIL